MQRFPSRRRRRPSTHLSAVLVLAMVAAIGLVHAPSAAAATANCTATTFTAGGADSAGISNGALYMWGNNSDGQLGAGVVGGGPHPTPEAVVTGTGLTSPVGVWTSGASTLAVDSSGQLWGWGDNHFGELAQPTTISTYSTPTRITVPVSVSQASTAGFDTLAVGANGTAWGWGMSPDGELGFIRTTPQTSPVELPGLSNVVQVSDGDFTSVVLKADGTVYGAGQNLAGELGLGSGVAQSPTFQPLPGLSNVIDLSINKSGFFSTFVLALDQSGHVFAAGNNQDGEMGNGTPSHSQVTFAAVPNLDSVAAVSAGDRHVLALRRDGTVWAWGSNSNGQLGNGTFNDSASPIQVSFPAGTVLTGVAAGFLHSTAVDSAGNMWAWGSNTLGELGTGTAGGFITTPVKVHLGPVATPCGSQPRTYIPSKDGYKFNNSTDSGASKSFYIPTYDEMAAYYPASRDKMYHDGGTRSRVGNLFYTRLFVPFYTDGLCFGMATTDTFLYNRASPPPGTYGLWTSLDSSFGGDGLTPPVSTGDPTIQQFIDRYHARQLAALGAKSAVQGWASIAFDTGPGQTYDRTFANLGTFDKIKAQVAKAPEVIVFGPSPYILTGGPRLVPNPKPRAFPPFVPQPAADPTRWYTLFNNSHAVVAYDTLVRPDGTRVIKVYDPSSATVADPNDSSKTINVIDRSEIDIAPDGGIKLVDFANGAGAGITPTTWIGGGTDTSGRNMGLPNDWILVPLPDVAFSDNGNVNGFDNHHWVIPDLVALAINDLNAPWSLVTSAPTFFHISAPGSGSIAETLATGAGYDNTVTATGTGALTAVTLDGHLVTATQTDSNAAGSTHHVVVDPSATSIQLDSATQVEMFDLEVAGDYLPAFSRDITMQGMSLAPSQTISVSSDGQTSILNVSSSSGVADHVSTTFAQTGANPGQTIVLVTVPANSVPAVVSVFDWNNLGSSLIYEVIDSQGNPSGLILQANPVQLQQRLSQDFVNLQATVAGVADEGLRTSLQAKVASAQDSFARGQMTAAANSLEAMRHEVDAQAGKNLDDATAKTLRQLSADAIVLLGGG